jgi:hypothetical protein
VIQGFPLLGNNETSDVIANLPDVIARRHCCPTVILCKKAKDATSDVFNARMSEGVTVNTDQISATTT